MSSNLLWKFFFFFLILCKTPGEDEKGARQIDNIILDLKTPEPQTLNDELEKIMKEIEENDNKRGITLYTPYLNKKNPFRCIGNLGSIVPANQTFVMLTNCITKVLCLNSIKQIAIQLL